MNAAKGLKRLGIGIAALAIAGVVAATLVPRLIPADRVRDTVRAEIRTVTGLDVALLGNATVSLFPTAQVSFGHVVLGDEGMGDPALTAQRLTAQLRLASLILGRIEIADVTLTHPTITLAFDEHGHSNWAGLIETLARGLNPDAKRADRLSFSEIRVDDGIVRIRNAKTGASETLSSVGLSLAWPSISRSFGANGQFEWRNEHVTASVNVSDLFAAITGKRAGIKVRIAGAPLKLAFDGHMSRSPSLKIEGVVTADSPSLRQALIWTGQTPLPGGGFGHFSLKAKAQLVGGTLSMPTVNVELDGNAAEGVLAVVGDGRPTIQGTLAADQIDLTPYLSNTHLLQHNDQEWSESPIALDGLSGLDFDLRLSAAGVTVRDARLGRTAVAASLRNGRMTLTIGEAQGFGGRLTGSIALAKHESGADLKAHLQFTDVAMEKLLPKLFDIHRLRGTGSLALALDGAGPSVLALTRTLNGSASLTARNGALASMTLEHLLRRLDRWPLSATGEFRGGRTPFDKLSIVLKINQGTATVEDVQLEDDAVRIAVAGSASIPARDLDLNGVATLVNVGAADKAGVFELPFVVRGPWDDPVMLPNAQILIKRSRATAPLLDALKDRKTRNSVRSAIERLTHGGTAAPSEPAASATPAAASNP